jgi:hypothetical protein
MNTKTEHTERTQFWSAVNIKWPIGCSKLQTGDKTFFTLHPMQKQSTEYCLCLKNFLGGGHCDFVVVHVHTIFFLLRNISEYIEAKSWQRCIIGNCNFIMNSWRNGQYCHKLLTNCLHHTLEQLTLYNYYNVRLVLHTHTHTLAGRIAKMVKCWTHRPKGIMFEPRLDHKRCSK